MVAVVLLLTADCLNHTLPALTHNDTTTHTPHSLAHRQPVFELQRAKAESLPWASWVFGSKAAQAAELAAFLHWCHRAPEGGGLGNRY